jgi:hypothetical protein
MLGFFGQELLVSILTTRNQSWKSVSKTYYCKRKLNIPRDEIRWKHLVEHFQSLLHPCSHIWHACGWGYSLWLLTHNHFEWSPHEPTCPLQVPNTVSHIINTPTKVIWSCNKPSYLHVSKMCYKMHSHSFLSLRKLWYWDMWDVRNNERHWMYILLPCCLHLTCPNIITFQKTRLCECILLNDLQASFVLTHL